MDVSTAAGILKGTQRAGALQKDAVLLPVQGYPKPLPSSAIISSPLPACWAAIAAMMAYTEPLGLHIFSK